MKSKYICVAPSKDEYDIYGNYLGESGKKALYYSARIGEHRIYRNSYPDVTPFLVNNKNINDDLILFRFDTKREAKKLCEECNEIYVDNFKPILEGVDND